MLGVYQQDAGFLQPERSIAAHVTAAQKLGAEVHGRERVIEWRVASGEVSVRTDCQTYQAKKLIVTAGPWAREIAPFLQNLAVPERQVVMWTQPLKPESFSLGTFPVFNMESPYGRFYGFPVYGIPGFKIGRYHHLREVVDPDTMDRQCHIADEEVLRVGIRNYFPDADGPTLAMKACLFTNSPDEHFIIDFHPDHPEVAVAAGFSGHGFKFCCVVGEIMAQLVLDGRAALDIAMFRLARLAHQPKTYANTSGATIEASLSMMCFGVSMPSLPQVIFSFGTAPEYEP